MTDENTTEQIDKNSDFAGDTPNFSKPTDSKVHDGEPEVDPLRRLSRKEYFQLTFGAYMALLPALLAIILLFVLMYVIVRFVW